MLILPARHLLHLRDSFSVAAPASKLAYNATWVAVAVSKLATFCCLSITGYRFRPLPLACAKMIAMNLP